MSAIYGIVGGLTPQYGPDTELHAMSVALRRRAPDDDVRWVDAADRVAVGFRFLRTEFGEASPGVLFNEDRSLMMVCDGHVFNGQALRSYLRDRGHRVPYRHSCELLLHLYEEEGPCGWRRADGQFALALWDVGAKRLVLGRDFLGVRPLYYWRGAEGVVFASEIKAILRHSQVPRTVDETAVADFLTFTSVPGPETLFQDIRKVQAGTAVTVGIDGPVGVETYWDLLQHPIPESSNEGFYVERVRALHHASVARRDVEGPVGSLLSGGNDSSANASLLSLDRSRTLHTFTVGLADLEGSAQYSDIGYARRVAASIGSVHHERLLSTDEFLQTIPSTIDAMDDLVSEPSCVFLHHALQLAADQGLRVVITGEANDELCCGHGGMVQIREGYYRRWLPYLRQPFWVRRVLAGLVPALSPTRRDVLQRAVRGDEYFWSYETAWMDTDKAAILAPDVLRKTPRASRVATAVRNRFDASAHAGRDYLAYVIYAMMQDVYFTNLMLGKLDLLAASLGIEARCPYTAPAYAHFVFNIPASLKTRNGLVKYFFKKAIEGVLDSDIIYRPKQGFRTPVVELFRGALGKWAEPLLLDAGLTRQGLLRRDHLADTLRKHRRGERDYSNRLWAAMSLNLWHERWIGTAAARSAA
ncbi:MAG TPA: asparagine synthase (glutamine-hydrolyzing) [Vicinamibacterales bacterium]|jgi:asparagine synthase (glutamine-hydrolysing)